MEYNPIKLRALLMICVSACGGEGGAYKEANLHRGKG